MSGRLPIPKPVRVESPAAIACARREWCEWCGVPTWKGAHVHHHQSRGARGDDVAGNLISLCWKCHDRIHRALVPRWLVQRFLDLRAALGLRDDAGRVLCGCGVTTMPRWTGKTFECPRCGPMRLDYFIR